MKKLLFTLTSFFILNHYLIAQITVPKLIVEKTDDITLKLQDSTQGKVKVLNGQLQLTKYADSIFNNLNPASFLTLDAEGNVTKSNLIAVLPDQSSIFDDVEGNPATKTSTDINYMNGNIGIGIQNPNAKLHVEDGYIFTTADKHARINVINKGNEGAPHFIGQNLNDKQYLTKDQPLATFQGRDKDFNAWTTMTMYADKDHTATSKPSRIDFATIPENGILPRLGLRILSNQDVLVPNGKLGIDTTTPTEALTIGDSGLGLHNGGWKAYTLNSYYAGNDIGWKTTSGGAFGGILGLNPTDGTLFMSSFQGDTIKDLKPSLFIRGNKDVLLNSNAGKTGIGIHTPASILHVNTSPLGENAGDEVTNLTLSSTTGNFDQIVVKHRRYEDGNNWFSAESRIQKVVDVTPMGFISFNASSALDRGLTLGVSEKNILNINKEGLVGIGTESPTEALTIGNNNINFHNGGWQIMAFNSDYQADAGWLTNNGFGSFIGHRPDNGDMFLSAFQGDSVRTTNPNLRLKANGHVITNESRGNLGVGVADPQKKLHVAGEIMSNNIMGSTPDGALGFYSDPTFANGIQLWGAGSPNSNQVHIVAAGVPMVSVIGNNGNIGVGTNNPRVKLEVAGSTLFNAPMGATPSSNPDVAIISSFRNASKTNGDSRIFDIATDPNNSALLRSISGDMRFVVGATEQMQIKEREGVDIIGQLTLSNYDGTNNIELNPIHLLTHDANGTVKSTSIDNLLPTFECTKTEIITSELFFDVGHYNNGSYALTNVIINGEPMIFENLVKMTSPNPGTLHNSKSTNAWDSGATGKQTIKSGEDGYIEFTVGSIYSGWVVSLGTSKTPGVGITGGAWPIGFSGSNPNTFGIWDSNGNFNFPTSNNDRFKLEKIGQTLRLYQNGILIYTWNRKIPGVTKTTNISISTKELLQDYFTKEVCPEDENLQAGENTQLAQRAVGNQSKYHQVEDIKKGIAAMVISDKNKPIENYPNPLQQDKINPSPQDFIALANQVNFNYEHGIGTEVNVFKNGLLLREGASFDYLLKGTKIIFNKKTRAGDWIRIDFD